MAYERKIILICFSFSYCHWKLDKAKDLEPFYKLMNLVVPAILCTACVDFTEKKQRRLTLNI